jgi:hypothetical protein
MLSVLQAQSKEEGSEHFQNADNGIHKGKSLYHFRDTTMVFI